MIYNTEVENLMDKLFKRDIYILLSISTNIYFDQ